MSHTAAAAYLHAVRQWRRRREKKQAHPPARLPTRAPAGQENAATPCAAHCFSASFLAAASSCGPAQGVSPARRFFCERGVRSAARPVGVRRPAAQAPGQQAPPAQQPKGILARAPDGPSRPMHPPMAKGGLGGSPLLPAPGMTAPRASPSSFSSASWPPAHQAPSRWCPTRLSAPPPPPRPRHHHHAWAPARQQPLAPRPPRGGRASAAGPARRCWRAPRSGCRGVELQGWERRQRLNMPYAARTTF